MSKDFEPEVLSPQTAVERTQANMVNMTDGRKTRRKVEKATRKRMRR